MSAQHQKGLAVMDPQHSSLVPQYSLGELERVATVIYDGGMFGMKSIPQVMTLLLVAQAEGMHPVNALREFHVIEGKPSLKADAMLARHQRSGGKVNWITRSDACVEAEFIGPLGTAKIRWDQERATRAKLWGKDNFQKHPLQMLAARCVSEGVRAVNPAAIQGFYTPEEVQFFDDGQKSTYNPTERKQPAKAQDTRPEFEEVKEEQAVPQYPAAPELAPPIDKPAQSNSKYAELDEVDYAGLLYQFRRVSGATWAEAQKKLDASMLKSVNARIASGSLRIPKDQARPRHLPVNVAAEWLATYLDKETHENWGGEDPPFSVEDAKRFVRGEWDDEVGDLGPAVDMDIVTTTE